MEFTVPQRSAAPGSGPSAGHRRRRPARPGRSASPRRPSYQGRPQRPAPPRTPVVSELERALTAALSAPAPAATTFAELGLPGPLVAALSEQGITAPFAIQTRALPDALAGRDVLGRAQTGSGKTLAFGLPLLEKADPAVRAVQALVLVPTRE
ncbi:MAG: DEAD/DEAH box helicase, partial [Pseudonocardiales bacterium]